MSVSDSFSRGAVQLSSARLLPIVCIVLSKVLGKRLFEFVKSLLYFDVVVVVSSVTIVYPRSDQSSTGGLDV